METLNITTLGGFTLKFGDNTLDERHRRLNMMWLLLEYLIIYRHRDVPNEELVEVLRGRGDGGTQSESCSKSVLKSHFFRLRGELDKVVPGKTVITSKTGSYSFNPEIDYRLDCDEFETLYKSSIRQPDKADVLNCCMKAINLYKGGFLRRHSSESWVAPLNAYYRSLYVKMVLCAIDIFEEEERFDDIIMLCRKVLLVDVNDWSIKERLARITNLFHKDIEQRHEQNSDLNSVINVLGEGRVGKGAFYCDYESFKRAYILECRACERGNRRASVFLTTVNGKNGEIPHGSALEAAMHRLFVIISDSLRIGDVYAKFSSCQYVMMLKKTDKEICKMILDRLNSGFAREEIKGAEALRHEFHLI